LLSESPEHEITVIARAISNVSTREDIIFIFK
jgi:hypothetical protein